MDISGDYHPAWRQDLLVFIIVGKRGKMQRMTTATPVLPGATSSLLPGEVRHSLGNGAMEKGASASAPSSTSGDEIVGKGGSRDPINSPKRTTFRVTCIRDLATWCYMLPTAIQSSSTTFMG